MIIVKLKGGLGNQMFQYAIGRAIAAKNNTEVSLDLTSLNHRLPGRKYVFRNYALDIFDLKQKFTFLSKVSKYLNNFAFILDKLILNVRIKLRPKSVKLEKEEFSFDSEILNSEDGVYLDGYWQHSQYFSDISDLIKKDFLFKDKISNTSEILLEEIKRNNSVCLHVRRGDYVSIPLNQEKFTNLTSGYYNEGVEYLENKFSDLKFYIFSDDLAWCKENLTIKSQHTFVGPEYEGDKLRDYFELMQSCKKFIISNSTFSWWAAWLSSNKEKVVIAPKFWLNDKSVDTSGLLLNEWIKI